MVFGCATPGPEPSWKTVESSTKDIGRARAGIQSPMPADVRSAIRFFLSDIRFTAVAVLSLALGISASTVIFSVVYTALIAPLPFAKSDRIIVVTETDNDRPTTGSPQRFRAPSIETVAAYYGEDFSVRLGDVPERIPGIRSFGDLQTRLVIGFGLAATLLAAIGIWSGVPSRYGKPPRARDSNRAWRYAERGRASSDWLDYSRDSRGQSVRDLRGSRSRPSLPGYPVRRRAGGLADLHRSCGVSTGSRVVRLLETRRIRCAGSAGGDSRRGLTCF
jgi:hypothetical protein